MNAGKIIGITLFAGATAAIWMWPSARAPEAEEMPVRPVRSAVVEGSAVLPEAKFTGVVRANATRTLSFKESGRIESIPVSNGQRVRKGEILARLFDGDFTNRVETCRAAAERDRLSYRRIGDAAKRNAVSKEELSRAESQLRQSEAQLALAERALRATVIYSPFDGVVAKTVATELEVVNGVEPVVEVQDLSVLKVDVAVPESVVIRQRRVKSTGSVKCYATFDSFPSRRYEVEFVEFTARADEKNQTFTATYRMEMPKDLLVLPGMSATVTVPAGFCRFTDADAGKAVSIPENAVGVDGQGGYFVWKLEREVKSKGEKGKSAEEGGDSVYTARKQPIGDCSLAGGRMTVGRGLVPGDRIATAGVAVLMEGRRVTILK